MLKLNTILLRKQKNLLADLIAGDKTTSREAELLEGVLNLVNYVSDRQDDENVFNRDKDAYISGLMVSNIKAKDIGRIGNLFWHAEIPFKDAKDYINTLIVKDKIATASKTGRRITDR